MPSGSKKSRTFRRVYTRVPSGTSKLKYKRRKPGKLYCLVCNRELHGMKIAIATKLKSMAKTKKRPSRPFAGKYCAACSREKIKELARI